MKQLTIAIDIDDVLAASTVSWVDYSNKHWGTNLRVEDYDEDWAKMWQVDRDEAWRRAHQIHTSGMVRDISRFDEAEAILKELGKKHKLVIATSRQELSKLDTLAWIDMHFKGLFKEVHLAGFYDGQHADPASMTKAELCKSIGADYLIDDQPKHCFAAAEAGIGAVLFGNYHWNRSYTAMPKGVMRAYNWQDVLEFFNERS